MSRLLWFVPVAVTAYLVYSLAVAMMAAGSVSFVGR